MDQEKEMLTSGAGFKPLLIAPQATTNRTEPPQPSSAPSAVPPSTTKRKRTAPSKKKNVRAATLGRLADPPPEGLPREAVESFLSQVELQLELAKTLVDFYPNPDDALKVHRLLHDRIKELSQLADACIAEWTDFGDNDQQKSWKEQTLLDVAPEERLSRTPKPTCRWTDQEVAMFNQALETLDTNKRGVTKLIRKFVPSKTAIQIRDRLRRVKLKQKQELSGASPADGMKNDTSQANSSVDDGEEEEQTGSDDKEDEDNGSNSDSSDEEDFSRVSLGEATNDAVGS